MADDRTFWLFPLDRIHTADAVIDLDADQDDAASARLTRNTAVASVQKWLETYEPPVLIEHRRDGMVLGRVKKVKVCTQRELADQGVQSASDAALVSLQLDDEVAQHYDRGRIEYCSPGLAFNYTDDQGETWPLAITEVSLTGDPRMKTRQPRASSLRHIQLSDALQRPEYRVVAMSGDGYNRMTPEVIMYDDEKKMAEDGDEPDMPDMSAMLAEVMRRLDDIEARMSAMDERADMADTDDVKMSDGGRTIEMSDSERTIAQLQGKIEAMEAERVREKAVAHVRAQLSECALAPEQKQRLEKRCVRIVLSDGHDALGDVVAALPKLDGLKKRPETGASGGPVKSYDLSDAAQWRQFVDEEHGGDLVAANRARREMNGGAA